MKTRTRRIGQRVQRMGAFAVLGLVIVLVQPQNTLAQWATNGNNISNTNPGNVGVGTTSPATKLDVAGVTRSQAFNISGLTGERVFSILWNNGVANQKVQVYWPASTQVDGIFEITVTGHYWFSNSNGGIRKRIVINGRNIGVINMQQSEVPFRLGFTGNSNTISNIMWDASNSRYYFIVSNLDNAQNAITIHVRSITPGPATATADNLNITPIYTSDATVYPQLFNSFMSGNTGVGTNTPGYKLDVQGGQLNASGGLCINGDCKTAWSQVGGGGSSQWLGSGPNIYFNTGSVGIGTASPIYSLDVNGGLNGFRSKTSSTSANDAIATFENSSGIQAIMRGNGLLGLGTTNPAVRLAINGSGANIYNTDAWIENNMHVQGNETLGQGGRGRLRVGTAWGYAGLYSEASSTSAQNDLVLGAGSGNVRVGPGGAIQQNFVVPFGNVGIGTSTPVSSRLHLYSPSNTYLRIGAPLGYQSAIAFNDDTNGQDIVLYRPENTRNFSIWTATSSNVVTVTQPGSVGVGTSSPSYKFDVQGGQINASGGLCIAGDCKTAWSQVGGGGSQWTTAGSSIYYSGGNVGIGTTTPLTRLTVQGPVPSATTDIFRVHSGATLNGTPIFNVASVDTAGGARAGTRLSIYGDNIGNAGLLTFDWFNPVSGNKGLFSGPNGITFYANAALTGGSPRAFTFRSVDLSPFGGPNAVLAVQNAAGADLFLVQQAGNVGIGTIPNGAYKLDVNGNTNVTGDINVTGNINAKYQDVAEWVPAIHALTPGTVVTLSLTKSNHVQASSKAYDTSVAGVISERPGIALGERGENKVLVATTGRVRIKVDATNGPIRLGDLLVTSDREGFAMKSEVIDIGSVAIHRPGTLIGKALEPLEKGTGTILVLLSLQ